MRKAEFKVEFKVVEEYLYFTTIEAETPEQALELFESGEYDSDQEQDDMLSFDNVPGSAEVVGVWIKDKNDSSFASLKRLDPTVQSRMSNVVKDVMFDSETNFTGRNGTFKQIGVAITPSAGTIRLEPLTSKGHLGHCTINIPKNRISELILALTQAQYL